MPLQHQSTFLSRCLISSSTSSTSTSTKSLTLPSSRSLISRQFTTCSPSMFALTPFRPRPGQETQPKTWSRQHELPRLPIPPLEQTLPRYLASLEPILRQKEKLGELKGSSAQQEMEKRKEWAQELLQKGSLGSKLQNRLVDVDRTTPNNWLNDRYWLVAAYHSWRVPLLINSNWWIMFIDDPNMPPDFYNHKGDGVADLEGHQDAKSALGEQAWDQGNGWGVRRATWMIGRFLEFKKRLDDEDIMPDASRAVSPSRPSRSIRPSTPVYYARRMFGVTRIPGLPHDWNTEPNVKSNHITVIARDNYYHLDVLRPSSTHPGRKEIVPLDEIERALNQIVEDAKKGDGAGVGVLTSDARDTWARSREELLNSSPKNEASLRSIEDSIFAVSLESSVLPLPSNHEQPPHPATPAAVDAHARNCSGAGRGAHNRWFDKALNITVEPNGRLGMNGEHSPCDALIPSILTDYAVAENCPPPGSPFPSSHYYGPSSDPNGPTAASFKKLEFEISSETAKNIEISRENARKIAKDSDIRMLWFDEYGADWIKKVGKHSPDAYLQMALQLAFSYMHGKQTPTYETASTRLFRHGRTDVIRTFSNQAFDFVSAVRDGNKSPTELYNLLQAATKAHNTLTRDASMGKGYDRHVTGLRLVYNAEVDGEPPKLLVDPLLGESQTWRLSTSGLSAGDRFAGTGFGAGYEDGYGCNYLAGGKLLKFGLESKHPNPETSTTKFALALVEALRTMRNICEQGAPTEEPVKGKL